MQIKDILKFQLGWAEEPSPGKQTVNAGEHVEKEEALLLSRQWSKPVQPLWESVCRSLEN